MSRLKEPLALLSQEAHCSGMAGSSCHPVQVEPQLSAGVAVPVFCYYTIEPNRESALAHSHGHMAGFPKTQAGGAVEVEVEKGLSSAHLDRP